MVTTGNCSGTLIADRVVLTAAHCLPPEMRALRPVQAVDAACPGLEAFTGALGDVWEDPAIWYPLASPVKVGAGNARSRFRLIREATDYALPRCADVALLRLDLAFPYYIARALPVLTTAPEDPDRLFTLAPLRFAGWGIPGEGTAPALTRQTGPADYWARNRCFLIALPPWRGVSERILQGDSGGPLLWRDAADREVVIGVLWGAGIPDGETCGAIVPRPPLRHGAFTATFRPPIAGTGATDIGDWLRSMVPEATHVTPPE